MKAEFKKTNRFLFFICLINFLLWSGLTIFLISQNALTQTSEIVGCFLIVTVFFILLTISGLYNHKAYLKIENNRIKGRFGLFKSLDCNISDITFVLAQIDRIHIILNDKKYNITGIKNAYAISTYIKQRLPFSPCDVTEELLEEIKRRKQNRKKNVILVFCAVGFSFVWLLITVILTGGRDLPEFGSSDWIIFSTMCILEVITFSVLVIFAVKAAKGNMKLEKQIYEVKRSIIECAPLLWGPGHVRSVLTDSECSHRITIFYGCTENEERSVCFNLEILNDNNELLFVRQSEILTNEEADEAIEMFEGLLDITENINAKKNIPKEK